MVPELLQSALPVFVTVTGTERLSATVAVVGTVTLLYVDAYGSATGPLAAAPVCKQSSSSSENRIDVRK